MASVHIDGAELMQLGRDLGKAPAALGQLARTVVRKTAKDIEASAKSMAPVDTGNLKSSIGTTDLRAMGTSGSIEAEVGPTANYGIYLEFGTSRMAPQPFMGPALEKNSPAFEQAMAEIAERAINGG